MAQGHRPQAASERAQVLTPVPADLELQVVAHHRIDHQVDQLVLAGDVAVERCRSNTELDRQGPHRDRLDSLRVGQLHRGRGDLLA